MGLLFIKQQKLEQLGKGHKNHTVGFIFGNTKEWLLFNNLSL